MDRVKLKRCQEIRHVASSACDSADLPSRRTLTSTPNFTFIYLRLPQRPPSLLRCEVSLLAVVSKISHLWSYTNSSLFQNRITGIMNSPPPTYEDDDDVSTEPFVNQPVTKSLWRYPVKFVSASSTDTAIKPAAPKPLSIADQYLAIVLPNGLTKKEVTHPICPTCKEPITEADERAHFLSIGHQMAIPRGPTPSSIDRTRMGLKYMEKFGWDVDSRKGLGATGEGILAPIIPKEKRDNYGLGLKVEKQKDVEEKAKENLDAGKMKKKIAEDKKKAERLQRMFYGDDNVEQYLEELDSHTASTGNGISLGAFKVTKKGRRQ